MKGPSARVKKLEYGSEFFNIAGYLQLLIAVFMTRLVNCLYANVQQTFSDKQHEQQALLLRSKFIDC